MRCSHAHAQATSSSTRTLSVRALDLNICIYLYTLNRSHILRNNESDPYWLWVGGVETGRSIQMGKHE